jgi:hypothetical protein
MIKIKHFPLMDRLGMSLSVLCAIHCIGTPFLLMSAPWLTSFLDNDFFHVFMFLFVFPLAIFSLGHTRSRDSNKAFFIGVVGLFLLATGPVIHEFFHVIEGHDDHHFHIVENVVTIIGGGLLFIAHYMNLKSCKCGHSNSDQQYSH